MDHLKELPISTAHEAIHVPYIQGGIYDNQGFLDYPERKGYDVEAMYKGNLRGRTFADARRLLQGWLFFGLLSAFLGTVIDPQDFIQEDGSMQSGFRLSTNVLEKRLTRWRERILEYTHEEKQQIAKELLSYIRTTSTVTKSKAMIELMGPELHLAICVLGSTLDKARLTLKLLVSHGIHQPAETEKPSADFDKMEDDGVSFGASSILRQRMLENGWCPFHVQRLENDIAPAAMYFSSMLQRPISDINHDRCTTDTCAVNNIDNATYKSKHSTIGCNCDLVKPPSEDVAQILKAGGIPVIAVKSRGPTDVELRVVPHWITNEESHAQKNLPYIAISHVWADGLGNTKDNSLPRCQIRRLIDFVGSVYARVENCRNQELELQAQVWGDDRKSIDDIVAQLKLDVRPMLDNLVPPGASMTSAAETLQLLTQALHDPESAAPSLRSLLETTQQHAHKTVAALRSHAPDVACRYHASRSPGEGFHWLLDDHPGRDFMAHHGDNGDYNLDWKAYDQKTNWMLERKEKGIETDGEALLWIDTLCVPLERGLRNLALQRMKEVYANSEKVLVLDEQLLQSSSKTSYEECLMRISLSSWMQRAWTLEEAVVGGILLFMFKDGVFDLWQFGRTWLKRSSRSVVLSDACRPFCSIRGVQQPRHHVQQLQRAYDALENRITTKRRDLNLIFSFMMGVHPRRLLESKDLWPARGQAFFDLQQKLSRGLIWIPNSNKDDNYLSAGISPQDIGSKSVQAMPESWK